MSPSRLFPFSLLLLFSVSGVAALVYEVCWLDQLAGQLSKSTHALAIVLASYLGGLALGARWSASRAPLCERPMRVYAQLEFVVVLAAACVPMLLRWICERPLTWFEPETAHFCRITLCGLVMLAATLPLGATFPYQIQAFVSVFRGTARPAGWILGFQTMGGAGGVLLAGFVLLPAWGIQQTHTVALGGTLFVATVIWFLQRPCSTGNRRSEERVGSGRAAVGPIVLASVAGACSLAWEVLFTRVLSFFLPNLAWSFSAVLAVYLAALAVGAMVAAILGPRIRSSGAVGLFAVIAAALSLWSLHWVGELYAMLKELEAFSGGFEGAGLFYAASQSSLVLVAPAACALAVVLPLSVGVAAGSSRRLAGRVYAANSLGSAVGSIAAGFWLVPLFGIKGAVVAVAVLVGGVGLVIVVIDAFRKRCSTLAWVLASISVVASVHWGSRLDLDRPLILDSGIFLGKRGQGFGRELVDVREGSVTVASVVRSRQEGAALYTDSFLAAGSNETYRYMKMLGHLPMLLSERSERAVVIAFGTGATAGAVSLHPSLRELTLVEISPEVLEMAPYFEETNHGLPDRAPMGGPFVSRSMTVERSCVALETSSM